MTSKNITGKTIKIIRESKKISQEQLAARLNVLGLDIDQTIISKIETQIREITDYEVEAIANALGVNIEDLFNKENSL